jgi:hypothetical protein
MNRREELILLDDYGSLPSRPEDPFLSVVEAALFIESSFGLSLSDEEICPEVLGSPEAIRRFVLDRLA